MYLLQREPSNLVEKGLAIAEFDFLIRICPLLYLEKLAIGKAG